MKKMLIPMVLVFSFLGLNAFAQSLGSVSSSSRILKRTTIVRAGRSYSVPASPQEMCRQFSADVDAAGSKVEAAKAKVDPVKKKAYVDYNACVAPFLKDMALHDSAQAALVGDPFKKYMVENDFCKCSAEIQAVEKYMADVAYWGPKAGLSDLWAIYKAIEASSNLSSAQDALKAKQNACFAGAKAVAGTIKAANATLVATKAALDGIDSCANARDSFLAANISLFAALASAKQEYDIKRAELAGNAMFRLLCDQSGFPVKQFIPDFSIRELQLMESIR